MDHEVARPRFHFTPARHWMNDPNGLIWVDGRFHVFFQHNPEGIDWDHMSWGHAVSGDLLTWEELPVAIPWIEGENAFSGSVVNPGDGRLVAVYTANTWDGNQAQALATSNDGGVTWTRFPGNPVLDRQSTEFRDPHVFWHKDRWVMLAVLAEERQVLIYSSSDLVQWEHLSTFGPSGPENLIWECPAFARLHLEDGTVRWVLLLSANPRVPDGIGSRMVYLVGMFDGRTFAPDDARRWDSVDLGADFYAGVTFGDVPGDRAIALAWAANWQYAATVPTAPWRGVMTLPRELGLRTSPAGPVLTQALPAELVAASGLCTEICAGTNEVVRVDVLGGAVVVTIGDGSITVVRAAHEVTGSARSTTRPLPRGEQRVTICVDSYVVEVFADGGAAVWTFLAFGDASEPLVITRKQVP
ncbi:glycoside hydrolase family 32 protein [Demequina sp.]|uniref:glycoside hydrolase family 32 protein n=1 Tax=Demequina sp. TaxID=2050685 RepID=UPI003D0E5220